MCGLIDVEIKRMRRNEFLIEELERGRERQVDIGSEISREEGMKSVRNGRLDK